MGRIVFSGLLGKPAYSQNEEHIARDNLPGRSLVYLASTRSL
jgi:hypothetical protein